MELWRSDGTSRGTILLRDINTGAPHSTPSFFTALTPWRHDPSRVKGKLNEEVDDEDGNQKRLYFLASDGEMAANRASGGSGEFFNKGWKGMQLWVTDGTFEGTKRAYDQTMNDMDVDTHALSSDWPMQMAAFQGSLYYPANAGTGATLLPKGFHPKGQQLRANNPKQSNAQFGKSDPLSSPPGSRSGNWLSLNDYDNEAMLRGVDLAFEVSDVDSFSGSFTSISQSGHEVSSGLSGTRIDYSLNESFEGSGLLKLRIKCSKGRLTLGHVFRLSKLSSRVIGDETNEAIKSGVSRDENGRVEYASVGFAALTSFQHLHH